MTNVSRALIVGGGIAGLSATIALQKAGVHCDVADIGDLGAVGAGIGIAGRAPNALDELGIYEEVVASGQLGLAAPGIYDTAGKLVSAPPPPPPELPGGKPPVGSFRPTLAAIMVKRARELGATLETGLSIESITDTDDCAVVKMTNGEVREYDFVIGADGVNSVTRPLIFPEAPDPEYAGQMSIRWLFPSEPIEGEGWYIAGDYGKMAFYHQPHPNMLYVPMVINMPRQRLSQLEAYEVSRRLMDMFTDGPIVEVRKHLTPESMLIARPFDWILLDEWYRGRTLLIGDAAHATTAHMGMGGGMALEDGVVLGQCVAAAGTIAEAFEMFVARRMVRARTVVETSVALSKQEQEDLTAGALSFAATDGAPDPKALMGRAMAVLTQPY